MSASRIEEFQAPLLVAWQLTNRCGARCLTCCEESGPDRTWPDELSAVEALDLAQGIIDAQIPYVAFGGGEPLGVPHCWAIFERLAGAGIGIKLETDARHIDAAAAERLAALPVQCIQVSVDGASAATHERLRPGSSFTATIAAIERLVARGSPPQFVFVPSRLNLAEAVPAFELAERLGCEAFVTGPLMRLGRAALNWAALSSGEVEWRAAVEALQERAQGSHTRLYVYPWDILTEMEHRLDSPQAMLLVVPNGMVKLMNALPFAAADLRRHSFQQAWDAYRSSWRSAAVREFIEKCRQDPGLLKHANETWALQAP